MLDGLVARKTPLEVAAQLEVDHVRHLPGIGNRYLLLPMPDNEPIK